MPKGISRIDFIKYSSLSILSFLGGCSSSSPSSNTNKSVNPIESFNIDYDGTIKDMSNSIFFAYIHNNGYFIFPVHNGENQLPFGFAPINSPSTSIRKSNEKFRIILEDNSLYVPTKSLFNGNPSERIETCKKDEPEKIDREEFLKKINYNEFSLNLEGVETKKVNGLDAIKLFGKNYYCPYFCYDITKELPFHLVPFNKASPEELSSGVMRIYAPGEIYLPIITKINLENKINNSSEKIKRKSLLS